ncbi:MAG: hypothetical protein SPL48_07630 [Bacteroidales bacterium]|nr:hypothetical protein [Bacteroidales bacterium]MDY6259727.1 hypothetical protein [Bacteroidales bacterium]
MKSKENKFQEVELLRSGMSDNANLLADDELSELFGGYQCGKGYCQPKYGKRDCPNHYCQKKFEK